MRMCGKRFWPACGPRYEAGDFLRRLRYAASMTTRSKSRPAGNDAEEEEFLAAVDEGLADVKAGRTVSYEKVRRWLLSWGTDKELPPPKCS